MPSGTHNAFVTCKYERRMTAKYEFPSAKEMCAVFLSFLGAHGLRFRIGWHWNRRSRDGVVRVEDGDDNIVAEMQYFSNTQRWSVADCHLSRLRAGSAKHLALLALVTKLQRLA